MQKLIPIVYERTCRTLHYYVFVINAIFFWQMSTLQIEALDLLGLLRIKVIVGNLFNLYATKKKYYYTQVTNRNFLIKMLIFGSNNRVKDKGGSHFPLT